MRDINPAAPQLEESLAQIIEHIKTRTSEIEIDLQRQLPQADVQLYNQLIDAHLSQFQESGVTLVTLISKYDSGTLDSSALLALAQWT